MILSNAQSGKLNRRAGAEQELCLININHRFVNLKQCEMEYLCYLLSYVELLDEVLYTVFPQGASKLRELRDFYF